MPDDRLFHKRLGHSVKVNGLSDIEEIVWRTYIQSADDFGVMLFSAIELRREHDRLLKRSDVVVQRMFERVRDVDLVRTFEHQGRTYAYQRDWQDWQKVRYPLRTIHPRIPAQLLTTCSLATQWLHTVWPGGGGRDGDRLPKWHPPKDWVPPDWVRLQDGSCNGSATLQDRCRPRARAGVARGIPIPFPISVPDPDPSRSPAPEEPARADEPVRVARGIGAGVMAGMLSRDHLNCRPPCERVCVPAKLHGILRQRHGGADPDAALDAFYADVRATLDPDVPIGEKSWAFWESQFAAQFGRTAGVSPKTAGNLDAAARFVARGTR